MKNRICEINMEVGREVLKILASSCNGQFLLYTGWYCKLDGISTPTNSRKHVKGPWMRVMECELCKSVMSNFWLKISYYQQGGIKRTLRLVRKGGKYSLGGKEGPKTCQFENGKKI